MSFPKNLDANLGPRETGDEDGSILSKFPPTLSFGFLCFIFWGWRSTAGDARFEKQKVVFLQLAIRKADLQSHI